MLYTVGKRDVYEKYIATDKNARKGIGGSVWKSKSEAQKHCESDFKVYGIEADWEKDTKLDVNGNGWHELIVNALLIKLD